MAPLGRASRPHSVCRCGERRNQAGLNSDAGGSVPDAGEVFIGSSPGNGPEALPPHVAMVEGRGAHDPPFVPFRHLCAEKMSVAFVPPKPKEFESTCSSFAWRAWFGT